MNTKELRAKKELLSLSNRQRQLIIGLLLGDGHLETQNGGKTYRLKVEHAEAQQEYLVWLANEFPEWILSGWYEKQKGTKKIYGFTTVSHASFRFYAQQFYHNGKKRIPPTIKKILTPLSIAIWFLDDGSAKSVKHKSLIIHSLGYTQNDLKLIQEGLKKFGLESSLHKQRNSTWRIYLPNESAMKVAKFVREIIAQVPSLAYKLDNIKPKK